MKHKINADEILKALPAKYYVLDLNSRIIVQSNDPDVEIGKSKCFQHFYNNNPCGESENCLCNQALKSGKSSFVIEKGTGTDKRFHKAGVSVLDNTHLLISIEDATEEFRSKKELKINSKRLERAERLADFGYWEFNIDEEVMIASTGAAKIYGAPSLHFSLEVAQKIPQKKYRKKLDKALKDLINQRKPYNEKFQIKRPTDGEIRYIHSIAEYREDKRMVFGVIHDITENEIIQNALVESENNLKHLFRHMNSGFAIHKIITNKEGKPIDYIFLDVNDKFEEITGLKRQDILNKRLLKVLPNMEKFWIERYGEVALTGEPVTFSDYLSQFKKHFEIAAYSPKKNYFAVTFTDVSARVESENALTESLADLKMAQQFAKIGNWKYFPHRGKIYLSDQVFSILEKDVSDDIVDISEYRNYFSKQDIEEISRTVNKALTDNSSFELKMPIKLSGKKIKWVEIIGQPPGNTMKKGGELVLPGTIQDITTSKNAEEELNTTNKLLRTVIDNIPDAIYMKDTMYRKLIANRGDMVNCGVKNIADIIGKSDYDIYPKEVADIYTDDDRRVIESGETIVNREEILPSKGKDRIILTSKFPLKNNKGQIIGLVGIGRDITQLKENQARLNLLQQTIQQIPLSVVITNKKGEIEFVNPVFSQITGYEYDEVIGKKSNILKSGLWDRQFYKRLWKTISSGKSWHGEFYNRKKDGSFYWESSVIAPVFDERGEIEHYVAVKEDITEKKQMFEDLRIAKERAEESSRLKSIFLTNLSHEIRTPLNGVLGFSNLICSGVSDPQKLEYYGEIVESSARRLTKVIEDIIDMSVLQTSNMSFEYTEFDVNDVLGELFELYKDFYNNRLSEIEFTMRPCNDRKTIIRSEKSRFKQTLRNVIDNAFKFTKNGFVRFGCLNSDDKELVLFVEDSGIGIDKNKLGVIFEPFRQVEEGDTRKYEGSGLGLAISAAIMEKLGGSIEVESRKGKGSVFYLKFNKQE